MNIRAVSAPRGCHPIRLAIILFLIHSSIHRWREGRETKKVLCFCFFVCLRCRRRSCVHCGEQSACNEQLSDFNRQSDTLLLKRTSDFFLHPPRPPSPLFFFFFFFFGSGIGFSAFGAGGLVLALDHVCLFQRSVRRR